MAITQVDRDEIFLLFALTESGRALELLGKIDELGLAREQVAPGIERREYLSVFNAIRLTLHFAGSVSRIFWPPAGNSAAAARGAHLRQKIGLANNHPLKQRALRNHIEHIDERLDLWTANSPRPFTAIEMILHEGAHPQTRTQALGSAAVVYDVGTGEIALFGDTFLLSDLKSAIKDVQKHISDSFATT